MGQDVGWCPLSAGGPPALGDAKEIAAGIGAELRAELASLAATKAPDKLAAEGRFEELVQRLESSLTSQIRSEVAAGPPAAQLEQARQLLEGLSAQALAMASQLQRYHMTTSQFRALMSGPLGDAVRELRTGGVLVPVRGFNSKNAQIPVYYFPSRLARPIRAMLQVIPAPPEDLINAAHEELKRVEYFNRE